MSGSSTGGDQGKKTEIPVREEETLNGSSHGDRSTAGRQSPERVGRGGVSWEAGREGEKMAGQGGAGHVTVLGLCPPQMQPGIHSPSWASALTTPRCEGKGAQWPLGSERTLQQVWPLHLLSGLQQYLS